MLTLDYKLLFTIRLFRRSSTTRWTTLQTVHSRPRPESTADVAAAGRAARAGGLEVSVRSGGHSYTCQSIKEGGVHFDLRRLDKIEVVGEGQVGRIAHTIFANICTFFDIFVENESASN